MLISVAEGALFPNTVFLAVAQDQLKVCKALVYIKHHNDGLTLHTERAWIQPRCTSIPWPAERGNRHTARTDDPSCSPSRRWSCGTPCGSVERRRKEV